MKPRLTPTVRRVRLTLSLAAALWLLLAPAALAGHGDEELPFKEATIFIEYNATAGDTGLQVFLDDDGWRKVTISDPRDRKLLVVKGRSVLGRQGLTELFFESVEPELADLPLVEFLGRFPEGEYEFEGVRTDGAELESAVEFTHTLPCAPEVAPEGGVFGPGGTVAISWAPVTEQVDPAATDAAGETVCADAPDLAIESYEVIVEGPDGELDAVLPPEVGTLAVPAALLVENALYRFEVLAKEEGGNQTITESYFCTGPDLTPEDCLALAEAR